MLDDASMLVSVSRHGQSDLRGSKLPLLLDDDEEPDLSLCLLYSRGLWAYPLTVRVSGNIKYICSGSCLKRLQSTG